MSQGLTGFPVSITGQVTTDSQGSRQGAAYHVRVLAVSRDYTVDVTRPDMAIDAQLCVSRHGTRPGP